MPIVLSLLLALPASLDPAPPPAPSPPRVQPARRPSAPAIDIDLARAMGTAGSWHLLAWQGPPIPDPLTGDRVPGPVRLCLSRDGGRRCSPDLTRLLVPATGPDEFAEPHEVLAARVVHAGGAPLLLLRVGSLHSGDGDQRIATAVYAYDRAHDRFMQRFAQATGRNNNQEVRVLERGPLAGRIVSAIPTTTAPFGYWITVHARDAGGRFRQVLRYRSSVRYGDGDRRAVIDAEMPAIERRLRHA